MVGGVWKGLVGWWLVDRSGRSRIQYTRDQGQYFRTGMVEVTGVAGLGSLVPDGRSWRGDGDRLRAAGDGFEHCFHAVAVGVAGEPLGTAGSRNALARFRSGQVEPHLVEHFLRVAVGGPLGLVDAVLEGGVDDDDDLTGAVFGLERPYCLVELDQAGQRLLDAGLLR